MTDIVFVTVPKRTTSLYYAGQMPESLARLKAAVQAIGYSAKAIDLNVKYYRKAILDKCLIAADEFWDGFNFYWNEKDKPENKNLVHWIDNEIKRWAEMIVQYNPRYVGISIFTNYSLTATYLLSSYLRKNYPDIKIVIGGFAIDTPIGFYKHTMNAIFGNNTMNSNDKIGDWFLKAGLIDYFITGEGEVAIQELLKNNITYPGINNYNFQQIHNLVDLPEPDFSDHVYSDYVFPNPANGKPIKPMLTISSSRGCVNKCNFCNIPSIFPKFRMFGSDFIYNQIVNGYKKHNITDFRFTDSVLNGSPQQLKWLEDIIDYQKENNVNFTFEASVIVLDEKRWSKEKFDLMYKAGFKLLAFGLESGSEKVRFEMNKKQPNEWVNYFIDTCLESGIRLSCSVIIGFPTETDEDLEDTIKFFKKHEENIKNRKITFELSTFSTTDCDMPLLKNNGVSLKSVNNSIGGWVADAPCDSFYTALKRTKYADDILDKLGYYVNNTSKMKFYDDMLDDPRYKEYYENWQNNNDLETFEW